VDSQALRDYFLEVHSEPAKFGSLDCVRFVIDGIQRGWGVDYRGILGYQDRKSACERLRISCGLKQAFTDELGEPIYVHELIPGDIAYFDDPMVGLVMDGYIAVKYRRTIVRTPMLLAACGWHTWVQ